MYLYIWKISPPKDFYQFFQHLLLLLQPVKILNDQKRSNSCLYVAIIPLAYFVSQLFIAISFSFTYAMRFSGKIIYMCVCGLRECRECTTQQMHDYKRNGSFWLLAKLASIYSLAPLNLYVKWTASIELCNNI